MIADQITPFVFDALPVRGALIHMSRSWRRMLRDHQYDEVIRETLGHAAAATGLIAQSMTFDGAITLQIQAKGSLRMLVMQCTSDLEVRGMASFDEDGGAETFGDLMQNAHCAITVNTGDRPHQGIVEIERSSLGASLQNYFARSVQVPSHVMLVTDTSLSGGILLQQMPGQSMPDDDDWNRLGFIVATLRASDFQNTESIELIGKLFAEDDVRVFESKPVIFRCRCSRQRAEEVLRMLGEEEIQEAVTEQGIVDVTCEYCGRSRSFDPIDILRLFTDNVVSGPDSVQ